MGGVLGFLFFGSVISVLIMAVSFPKKDAIDRTKLLWLLVLPPFWIYQIAMYFLAVEMDTPNPSWMDYPGWMVQSVSWGPSALIAATIVLVWYMRGARRFAASFGFINFAIMFVVSIGANIVVTGTFL